MKGLPGIPDNISPSSSGGFWVGIAATRHTMILDIMAKLPWSRNIAVKVSVCSICLNVWSTIKSGKCNLVATDQLFGIVTDH